MFSKCNQLFFDATFKSCPKSMYQIFNIAGFFKDIDGIITLIYIPMSNKSERLYTLVLDNILKILKSFNVDLNSITNLMMSDFEIALRNSIKNSFPKAILDGCYFHYSKLLWNYAKKLGLCSKSNLKKTKLFIFLLKIYPYIKLDDKREFFTEIDEHYKTDNKYNKYLKYYKNNWLNNRFVNMDMLNRDEYLNRTNNYLESFHHTLNNTIKSFHPRISYLVDKLRNITINKYEEYKSPIKRPKKPVHKRYSNVEDIYTFISKYNNKYKTKINPKIIIQSDEEEVKNIYKICDKTLEAIFDIDDNQCYSNEDLEIEIDEKTQNVVCEKDVDNDNENRELEDYHDNCNNKVNEIVGEENIFIESHFKDDFKVKKRKHLELENELTEFYSKLMLSSDM